MNISLLREIKKHIFVAEIINPTNEDFGWVCYFSDEDDETMSSKCFKTEKEAKDFKHKLLSMWIKAKKYDKLTKKIS